MASSRTIKPDATCLAAVDLAREAAVDTAEAIGVGQYLGAQADDDRVVSHFFACPHPAYTGWRWSVTVARASRAKVVTIDEVVLLPGQDAIIAPAWVPWRDRIQPGDLSPGDLLPTDEDDPRLVPTYLAGDVSEEWERSVVDEIGLGRSRVLSLEGRELASQRWYESEQGPDSPLAQSAPGHCVGCGFLVRLAGPLSETFGVCANEFANDDGRVVALNHGCGAHSEAQLRKKQLPPPLPDHVFDSVSVDDYEVF
jgi:hypothetical protein